MKTINVYTAGAVNQFFEFEYDGNSVILPYVTGNVLYVDGEEVLEYDPQTDTVTEIGETTAGDEEPTLEPEGVMIELEDVDIELVGDTVVKVYDKDGKALRLVNMENLVPGRSVDVVAATKKAVFLQEIRVLPSDASDYDFYKGADKYAIAQYKYDWKSGKVSEADFGYVLYGDDGSGLAGMVTDIFPMSVDKIDDDKALVDGGVVFFDSDMKVVCVLNDVLPGATDDFGVVGDLLKITDGSIVRYYDSEGNVVGEYLSSLGMNMCSRSVSALQTTPLSDMRPFPARSTMSRRTRSTPTPSPIRRRRSAISRSMTSHPGRARRSARSKSYSLSITVTASISSPMAVTATPSSRRRTAPS